MGKFSRLGNDLYDGHVSIDFVGRRLLWYAISAVIVLVAIGGLSLKGLNMGIEFEGGVEYRVAMPAGEANQDNVEKIREAVADTGIDAASAPIVNTSGEDGIRIQTEPLTNDEAMEVSETIQEAAGVDPGEISEAAIGATWGKQVADRAVIGLVVFTVLVVLFIWAYFREWKMSVAAIVALIHDVVITVGVYALSGFEVTPATVTGVLTILGFSLYDTVVVFDKVRENTKEIARSRQTYRQAANLAVNQTLVRSINTSVVALLPVGALLYVGVVTLGSGALKDLALALFVGMAAGAYSSIFIATPLLVQLKQRERGVRADDARAKARARHDARQGTRESVRQGARQEARQEARLDARRGPRQPAARDDARAPDEDETRPAPDAGRTPEPAAARTGAAGRPHSTSRPVGPSAAAKRAQPSRKPRSKRGKR